MTPRNLFLFDIDGTLISCRGRGLRAMHRSIQDLYELPPVELHLHPFGMTDPMLFEAVGEAYGLGPERIASRADELHERYLVALENELLEPAACAPKPGVGTLLSVLGTRPDAVLGLVSGNLEPAAWLKLRSAGLASFFMAGGFGSDGRRRSDLVGIALDRFAAREGARFAPDRVWVIGDTPADIAGGRAHGTRTLAVATGGFTRAELESCAPDSVLDDLADTDGVIDILCAGW